jgi:prepilin-type N-terminal cleavage/methylation domain-containing protein
MLKLRRKISSPTGFTLIELTIAIAISVMIITALYFSLRGALDSWQASEDRLFLQQVSARMMEEITEGLPDSYGLRDALELAEGSARQVSVVMPWTDDTHDVYTGIYTYAMNKHIKPGTPLPIAEALPPDATEYKVVPITLVDQGKSEDYPQVRLSGNLPAGTRLRFTFHPDYTRDSDCLTIFRYDEAEQAVFIEDKDGNRNISKNFFGVKITDFNIRYFDNTNTEVGQDGSITSSDTQSITGIGIVFKAKSKNGNVQETASSISLRNAPKRSGNLVLREGTRVTIPNSKEIRAFLLNNLSGINNEDEIILDAQPESGSDWRLKVRFSKPAGTNQPVIELYTVEYPAGSQIYTDRPRLPASLGLNLLSLGPNGLFDYDEDNMGDFVSLKGKVTLEVKKMDIGGAAVFVKP